MSYILEALKKSDQQRQRGATPTLPTSPVAIAAPKQPIFLYYGLLAAAVLADSVTRELESVLGNSESRMEESFDETGLLEYEQYTRPATYRGRDVPQVLLNGNHGEIERWRLKRRIINTAKVRPDLFARIPLTKEMETLHDETTKETEQ